MREKAGWSDEPLGGLGVKREGEGCGGEQEDEFLHEQFYSAETDTRAAALAWPFTVMMSG